MQLHPNSTRASASGEASRRSGAPCGPHCYAHSRESDIFSNSVVGLDWMQPFSASTALKYFSRTLRRPWSRSLDQNSCLLALKLHLLLQKISRSLASAISLKAVGSSMALSPISLRSIVSPILMVWRGGWRACSSRARQQCLYSSALVVSEKYLPNYFVGGRNRRCVAFGGAMFKPVSEN